MSKVGSSKFVLRDTHLSLCKLSMERANEKHGIVYCGKATDGMVGLE